MHETLRKLKPEVTRHMSKHQPCPCTTCTGIHEFCKVLSAAGSAGVFAASTTQRKREYSSLTTPYNVSCARSCHNREPYDTVVADWVFDGSFLKL